VSTSTLGGHVNTIQNQPLVDGRRRRRLHSDEFKANAVASCMQPGVSMAAVAMANGVNANLLRRWVREAELGRSEARPDALVATGSPLSAAAASFVPMQLPAKSALAGIRIELRRGATSVTLTWPTDAAAECAAWMRELLR
jgi:transposase